MKTLIKKTILIDLDGVLNNYDSNYDQELIPPIKHGAFEFIQELSKDFKIIIFTSRNLLLASKWIIENGLYKYIENVTNVKQSAFLIIDDRCISFKGSYEELKKDICNFDVWYKN